MKKIEYPKTIKLGNQRISLGEDRDIKLVVSESHSSAQVIVPVSVIRADKTGPTVFVTAAIHGDELNGIGVVREIIESNPFTLTCGSLILIPVVNMLGFERHMRYTPDRRDLNRSFPGSREGSLARRFAYTIFHELIPLCNYGIDLHTAAVRRTNFPNVRADMKNPGVARIAKAFGCNLIVNSRGPKGSLRRSACASHCPTLILEAGEVWKIESTVVESGIRGIRNVLIELGMAEGKPVKPPYQTIIEKTKWLRAEVGGILQFHVGPGDLVEKNQPVATNTNLFGKERNVVCSPTEGIILGMTTFPTVIPGDPICHIATPSGGISSIRKILKITSDEALHERLRDDLATSFSITERNNGDIEQPK